MLLPWHVLAQPEGNMGPVPHLGAHRFATTSFLRGPFIRTSLRNQLGFGSSGGVMLGTVAVGDTTI